MQGEGRDKLKKEIDLKREEGMKGGGRKNLYNRTAFTQASKIQALLLSGQLDG